MNISLSQAIHNETDRKFFPVRVYESVEQVVGEKGYASGSLILLAMAVSQFVSGALSYFCLEGSIRSIAEVAHNSTTLEHLRPLGDAAGWITLSVFSLLIMKDFYEKMIAEGEYYRVAKVCENWIIQNKEFVTNNAGFQKKLYENINDILSVYASRCFSLKSLASRRVKAWKILKHSGLVSADSPNGKLFRKEHALKNVIKKISEEQKERLSSSNFFIRCKESFLEVKRKGCAFNSNVFGVALPIFLLGLAGLTWPGEAGLGSQVLVNANDNLDKLSDRGHFGEWPINSLEAISGAIYLYLVYFLNEGDFAITRSIYAKHLDSLKDNKSKHSSLCKLANQALSEMASKCSFLQIPMEYKFEKI